MHTKALGIRNMIIINVLNQYAEYISVNVAVEDLAEFLNKSVETVSDYSVHLYFREACKLIASKSNNGYSTQYASMGNVDFGEVV